MRVMVVHNFYSARVPSGENLVVADEVGWLRAAGADVQLHAVSNDDAQSAGLLGKVRQAAEMPWSLPARRRFADEVRGFRPDVIHLHNLFPLLTGSVLTTALRTGAPVVWSCHNRRIVCVEGTNFRDGAPCHDCRAGGRLAGVRHGCYQRLAVARGDVSHGASALASGLVTTSTALFRAVARRRAVALGPTESVRRWLIETAGFPDDRVHVKHNGVPGPTTGAPLADPATRDTVLFAGQLADYKGVPLLLDAWRRRTGSDGRLHVLGDGVLAPRVAAAAAADPRIVFGGPVPPSEMSRHLASARVVVVPSTTEETFGRVAAEALAHGRPVITTGLGGLGEVVDPTSGWTTGVAAPRLAGALDEALASDALVSERGAAGHDRWSRLFSPEATTESLLRIYATAFAAAGRRTVRPG